MNKAKRTNLSSQHKGVHFHKRSNKWVAQIKLNRKLFHLGSFSSEAEAGEAYNNKAIELFGEFAVLNDV